MSISRAFRFFLCNLTAPTASKRMCPPSVRVGGQEWHVPVPSQGEPMQVPELNRRDFTKLAAAALGGMVAGASLVRADDEPQKKDPNKPLLLQEPHICRGLNPTCKGEVAWKKNDCAGQAHAATVKEHACK